MQTVLHVILTSLGSTIVLFILTKILGYRQMSQMSMFDYINGITIGSIAAEMATSLESDFLMPLTAMIVYSAVAFLISILSCHSLVLQRFFSGKPLILLDNGTLYLKNFKKAKLDLSDFFSQCRNNGYFDFSQIQTAVLESNGRISFLPTCLDRPVTPNDLNLSPKKDTIHANIILDGVLLKENLKHTGNNEEWLKKQLHAFGIKRIEDVFLATCDTENNVTFYLRFSKSAPIDLFQ